MNNSNRPTYCKMCAW